MKKNILQIIIFNVCILMGWSQEVYQVPRLSPAVKAVTGVENPILSLNGTWNFSSVSIPKTNIEVPGEWMMQGFDLADGEIAVYSRKIHIPADWRSKRIKVKFDGVSSYGLVKINGQPIGEHEGGMVPFELDITDAVQTGENELTVEVQSGTISDRLGCISQYACHTVGGIVRKVTLFALPEINIAGMDVVTVFDKSFKNAKLTVTTDLAKEATISGMLTVDFILKDHMGKIVSSKSQHASDTDKVESILQINNAKSWNPEQPFLYTLITTLRLDKEILQINEQRVGLRQIETKDNLLYVNGKPIKLRGVNRHEVHPLRGRSLTPELCRQDAELFKAGNCNYIRTSHYPPSEEFLEACDEIGLFVESESALNWIQHHASPIWQKWDYLDSQYLPYLMRANMDNILAGRKHPSVIIWSIANESRWSPLWEKVKTMVSKLDPSRPNSFHDQCWGTFNHAGSLADIANYHYPGINGPAACDTMQRPVLFGEYAHLSCYNSRELVTDPGVRAGYGKNLVEMYDSMYIHPACLGGAIWSGIDDVFHIPDGRIVGYGSWGPIDGWRREKPEYTGMKQAYTPFRIVHHEWKKDRLELTVENRYNFLNLNQVTIEAGIKDNPATLVRADIPARTKGKIRIPVQNRTGQELYVRVTDPNGIICHEEIFTNGKIIAENKASAQLTVEDKNNLLTIRSVSEGHIGTVIFNKTSGIMTRAYADNKPLLLQGPVFCLVPMDSDDGGKPNVAGETYQNNMYPFKNYPHLTLYATHFEYKKENDGSIMVEVDAVYRNGDKGRITYTFGNNQRIKVAYEMRIAAVETRPRQYGLLFMLPKHYDTLNWKRKGEFSVYPPHDIARTEGIAHLNANELYEAESWGEKPADEWKDDANSLGSTDFRSTKSTILKASLTDKEGHGITVISDGKQAWRCWLQDASIHLLIADYNNTGSERFYSSPFTNGRITVKKDEILKGEVVFELH